MCALIDAWRPWHGTAAHCGRPHACMTHALAKLAARWRGGAPAAQQRMMHEAGWAMRRTLAGRCMLLAAACACSPHSRARAASPTCSAHVARATAAAGALLLCANQWPPTPLAVRQLRERFGPRAAPLQGYVRNGMQRPPSNLPSNQLRYRRDHWCMWAMTTWVYQFQLSQQGSCEQDRTALPLHRLPQWQSDAGI